MANITKSLKDIQGSQNVQPVSEKTASSVIVNNGFSLSSGEKIVFDIMDANDPTKVLAGEQAIAGSVNVIKLIACHRGPQGDKEGFVMLTDLTRMCYRKDENGERKFQPASDRVSAFRAKVRGRSFPEVCEILASEEPMTVLGLENVERRKFGTTDEYEPFSVAILQ